MCIPSRPLKSDMYVPPLFSLYGGAVEYRSTPRLMRKIPYLVVGEGYVARWEKKKRKRKNLHFSSTATKRNAFCPRSHETSLGVCVAETDNRERKKLP
jgi:hypothetical protein